MMELPIPFVISYTIAVAWLVLILVYNLKKNAVPNYIVYVYTFLASGTNIILYRWVGVLAVTIAILVAVLFALTGAVRRNTTLVVAGTFLVLPLWSWWIAIPGMLAGAALSFWKIRKIAGKEYINLLTNETLAGFGLAPENAMEPRKPDLSRFPFTPPKQDDKQGVFHKVSLLSVPLTGYILVSIMLFGALLVLISL